MRVRRYCSSATPHLSRDRAFPRHTVRALESAGLFPTPGASSHRGPSSEGDAVAAAFPAASSPAPWEIADARAALRQLRSYEPREHAGVTDLVRRPDTWSRTKSARATSATRSRGSSAVTAISRLKSSLSCVRAHPHLTALRGGTHCLSRHVSTRRGSRRRSPAPFERDGGLVRGAVARHGIGQKGPLAYHRRGTMRSTR